MAIGIDRSGNYNYVGLTDLLNGVDASSSRNLQIGQSVKFYKVDTTVDLTLEDDAANEAFEAVVQTVPNILAMYAAGSTGIIHIVADGVNAPAASVLQTAIRAIGTRKGSVNLNSTTVTDGTSFTVS